MKKVRGTISSLKQVRAAAAGHFEATGSMRSPIYEHAFDEWLKQDSYGHVQSAGELLREVESALKELQRQEDFIEDQLKQIDRLLDLTQSVASGRIRLRKAKTGGSVSRKRYVPYIDRYKGNAFTGYPDSEFIPRSKLHYFFDTKGVCFGSRRYTKRLQRILARLLANRELLIRRRGALLRGLFSLRENVCKFSSETATEIALYAEELEFEPTIYSLKDSEDGKLANFNSRATEWRWEKIMMGLIEPISVSTKRRVRGKFGAN